ncbi:ATP-binding cassette domain-containing protein [Aestuariibacter halophilus]|uniref:ATP-binding cassette domain-containing protein n=1 Tax=Fluctibacter halophilus TaxID=226011 RepID=A0ABS8G7I4_9ALTE|nr:ABC transporter transmembrane domain-containing protein [Aestuariibacter halophilus]MCC2616562.1 ATP-binding cassette domain-containing protein [Aestuariibacter halophilus]
MSVNASQSVSSRAVMAWLFGHLRPYKWRVVMALLALLVGAACWLALGQGVKGIVDEGFSAQNPEQLNFYALVVIGLGIVGSIAAFVRFYWMIWLGERVSADIRNAVYHHLLSLPPSFFAQTRTGDIISRFTSDTTLLQNIVGMGLSMSLRASITFIGALLLMLITSPRLTLYVMIAVPLVLLPIRLLGDRVRRYASNSQDRVADMGAQVDETLHEIHTVQAYTHEARDRQAFTDRIERIMGAAQQRIRARAGLMASMMVISLTAITLVAWSGAHQVLSGSVSAGELTAFMFYAVMAGGSVATLSEVIGEVQKAAGASERLLALLAEKNPLLDGRGEGMVAQPVKGALRFEDVHFTYPGDKELPVLHGLNITINPGERVALVGPSGAGKSTLFQLLLGFYTPQQGQIYLDDQPCTSLSLTSLRQQFALVPQEPVIFAASVQDNIAYANPEASQQAVIAAAKAAHADEFIQALPQGYETGLGERGVRLSGGQKQRIAIARAMLADRPILLLDEATSALDASSEHAVKQALEELMATRTTLVIAHRLTTVVNADRILVLEHGKLVAQGTHNALLKSSPLYRDFARLQLLADESASTFDDMELHNDEHSPTTPLAGSSTR